jgi:glycolate oxidase iron-sulfur subunit
MKMLSTEEAMYSCVRCGACRDVCPTLDITGKEADGPRGRVYMARSVIEGEIPINKEIETQLDRCLLCSACVDACPMDVPIPDIVMLAKEKIKETQSYPPHINLLRYFFFERLLPYPKRLQSLGTFLWLYQKSGLRKITQGLGILKFFPESLREMEEVMPEITAPSERKPRPVWTESQGNGDAARSRLNAGMFVGCIMDVMFRKTNDHSIQMLSRSGYDVITPDRQVCCGALHRHNGMKESAMELAKRNIAAFEQSGADFVITNAGGCGAMLKEYGELLRDDPDWRHSAEKFSDKIRDISEVLDPSEMDAVGNGERITYQPSCHLQYVMSVKDAPKKLLKGVANTEYAELPEAKLCCGSAGIYNLLQPELASDILDKKMNHVQAIRPDIIITANPGCLLQMKIGIQRAGLQGQVKAMHIVDYLTETMERAEKEGVKSSNFDKM